MHGADYRGASVSGRGQWTCTLRRPARLRGKTYARKERKLTAKHPTRQRTFTVMCPLAPTLAPRFTVRDAFCSCGEYPGASSVAAQPPSLQCDSYITSLRISVLAFC